MNPASNRNGPARVFITGISGFAGSHLAELCLEAGTDVCGLSRDGSVAHSNLSGIVDRVALYSGDVGDREAMGRILADARPDFVFHLAAEIASDASEARLLHTNILGTVNVLAAAGSLASVPKVLVASSSAVYGLPDMPHEPIDERCALRPVSSYGLSKAAQDTLSTTLAPRLGVPVIVARAFNHTGPRERPGFVASSVAKQIAEIEAKRAPPRLSVGRLDTLRDFSDIRDIVSGYYLAATRGRPGEAYNLAAGAAVSIKSIVDKLVGLANVEIEIEIEQDASRLRASDVPCQIGDAAKARRELGWRPAISLDDSLRALLDYWRGAASRRR